MGFKGLVVGGHLAGEWRFHDLPTFTASRPAGGVIEMPDGESLYWDGIGGDETYVHKDASPHAEFWVLEGKNAAWALAELVRCYRAQHL